MQPQPDEDFPLTPRVEFRKNDSWFTNLYDLKAEVQFKNDDRATTFDVATTLQDEDRVLAEGEPSKYNLGYQFEADKVTITATRTNKEADSHPASLVIPIVSPTGETVRKVSNTRIEIHKPEGTVVIESNTPLTIKETTKGRVFNMVPGFEAIPIIASMPQKPGTPVVCTISVKST